VTLLCRPRGRGNWRLVHIGVDFVPDPLFVRAGQLVTIGDRVLRIVSVQP
jgi:hypothetical protein